VAVTLRLWLVRHGETAWSRAGRLTGWTDVPLARAGRRRAAALAETFTDIPFDGVWSSDLRRAAQTASAIAGDAVVEDRRLRELDFGALEGRTWDELTPGVRERLAAFDGFEAPGGGTVDELRDRVGSFLDDLPSGDHLVVTHGGVIRLLLRTWAAGSPERVEPGGWVRLDVYPLRP
jgi:probable phosphoglycerate mutase